MSNSRQFSDDILTASPRAPAEGHPPASATKEGIAVPQHAWQGLNIPAATLAECGTWGEKLDRGVEGGPARLVSAVPYCDRKLSEHVRPELLRAATTCLKGNSR
jgi:hypothetical protein